MRGVMNEAFRPGHPRWHEFCDRLLGPEGCDVNEAGLLCAGDHRACLRILYAMGATRAVVDDTLRYFRRRGGYCDCEVLMNVVRGTALTPAEEMAQDRALRSTEVDAG